MWNTFLFTFLILASVTWITTTLAVEDECWMKTKSCQDNKNKDIYITEPSDEDLKANKNDICTISKSLKDCLEAANCNNVQVDLVLAKSTQIADKCDEYMKETENGETVNWKIYDSDHLYVKLSTTVHSAGEAHLLCLNVGGMLPEPRNSGENDFVNTMTPGGYFFLGLTDIRAEGRWQWNSDGSTVALTFWESGEPAGGRNQNCAIQLGGGSWGKIIWTSVYCYQDGSWEIPVVCERRRREHDVEGEKGFDRFKFDPQLGKRQTKKRNNDLDIVSFNPMGGSPRHRVD